MLVIEEPVKINFIESINELQKMLDSSASLFITPVNAEVLVSSLYDDKLKESLSLTFSTVDGVGVNLFLFRKGHKMLEKLSGSDLVFFLTQEARKRFKNILIVGGTEEENKGSVETLSKILINSGKVVGYSPPFEKGKYLQEEISEKIFSLIEKENISYLYLCLGVPKQEIWMFKNRDRLKSLGVEICIALGGTCRFLSGFEKRAPRVISTVGLEWLYRLIQNPQRFRRVKWWLPKYLRLLLS